MTNKGISKTQSAIYVLLVLGIIGVANYILTRKFVRKDLTENKMYSISDASKNLLENLDDIINIKVYFSDNLPPQMKQRKMDVRDILEEFKAYAGGNLKITWQDPSEDEELKQEVRRLGIPEVRMQSYEKDKAEVINGFLGLAVLYEDKKEVIPVVKNMETFEYDIAQRILKVSRDKEPVVGILKTDTAPHFNQQMRRQMGGQLPDDPTKTKYEPIFSSLEENYKVEYVDISNGKEISGDIRTLIVPGGSENFFTERKLFEIDQYFMKGGNLIILTDAVAISAQRGMRARFQSPEIHKMLEHYGVKVNQEVVLDASCGKVSIPQKFGSFNMNVPMSYPFFINVTKEGFNSENPAVSGLNRMIIPWASPLSLKDSSAVALVKSSDQSWTEKGRIDLNPRREWNRIINEKKGADELRPHILMASLSKGFTSYFKGKGVPGVKQQGDTAGTASPALSDADRKVVPETNKGHLVVSGDSDFLSKENGADFNTNWILNVVDWLSLSENLIEIRSRNLIDRTIENEEITEKNTGYMNVIRWINILLMPFLLGLTGLFVYLRRRERSSVRQSEDTQKNNQKGDDKK